MDSNGLMSLNKEKKDELLGNGGIGISKNKEEIKESQTLSVKESNTFGIPKQPEMAEKKEGKEALDKKNEKLVKVGEDYLGVIDEKEIELDLREENLNKINLDLDRISDISDRSLKAGENRLQKLGHVPEVNARSAVKPASSLRSVGNRVIKNGRFSDEAIRAGLDFMNKVDRWAGRGDNQSEKEKAFYNALGSSDTISFLYVDGKPIREFVRENYNYEGSNNKELEKGVLSAYAAMITYRQNHAITLVRPTYINGHADVDIRNLSVDMSEFSKSRSARVKAVGNALNGDRYRQYCESAYRSEMRAKSAKAAISAEKKDNIQAIDMLTELRDRLKEAGKGSHQNYDDFVWAFHKYYDAVISLSSDPEDMRINKATLESLDNLNKLASDAATEYLKGKKMNLPRHKAVEEIRSFLNAQSGQFGKYLRELAKDETGKKTVDLSDLLAKEDAGFVVMGIEDEIQDLRQKKEEDENDLNQYTPLDSAMVISVRQKRILKMKNEINMDNAAKISRDALLESLDSFEATDEEIIGNARTFLQCAASALWKNKNHLKEMRQRYPYASDNTDMMLAIIARTQLAQIYSDDFKRIPALQTAMEMWNEQISSDEAKAMTYQSNFVGNKISKKDFDEKGGSAYNRYVTRMEANEIMSASHGFLAYKEVKGRPDVVRLVPSMPEYTSIYRGEATEKQIPLRKTMKTMFKTLVRLVTDENGHVKGETARYDNRSITFWIDELLRASWEDRAQLPDMQKFISDVVRPEMTRMLEAEYREKNIRGYKNKAQNDATSACDNYLELIKGINYGFFTGAPDASIDLFVRFANYLKSVKAEDIMNHKEFKNLKIDGRTLTAEEVTQALEEFKTEMQENEAEFVSFRNLDTDDVEMPGLASCNDNANINEVAMTYLVDNSGEVHARLNYDYKNLAKVNPDAALDAMMANLDNIVDGRFKKEKYALEQKAKIRELDEKRKKGGLDKKDKDTLKELYAGFTKFEWHRGANMGKVGNSQYTTESMAPLANQLIKSPFTNKILIGKYTSDKPAEFDDNRMLKHESMAGFYDHDDAFAQCKDRKNVVKSAVKEVLRHLVEKQVSLELRRK